MGTNRAPRLAAPESRVSDEGNDRLLLQIRSDRRLGHEWDDWDGAPLPAGGVFHEREGVFFQLAAASAACLATLGLGVIWLVRPRLAQVWEPLPGYLTAAIALSLLLALVWLVAVAVVLRTGLNWLPGRLTERGALPWLMPKLVAAGSLAGLSRDRVGNAILRVHNRLASARTHGGMLPEHLLILLPRCLDKESMRTAMDISNRYGVPLFVASRGRYARQMIALRRPRGVVAVACERDLVSGIHEVASRLPVLGTTLRLADGPCKNTEIAAAELEGQVRKMLGLDAVR